MYLLLYFLFSLFFILLFGKGMCVCGRVCVCGGGGWGGAGLHDLATEQTASFTRWDVLTSRPELGCSLQLSEYRDISKVTTDTVPRIERY